MCHKKNNFEQETKILDRLDKACLAEIYQCYSFWILFIPIAYNQQRMNPSSPEVSIKLFGENGESWVTTNEKHKNEHLTMLQHICYTTKYSTIFLFIVILSIFLICFYIWVLQTGYYE